ncbi:MAG: trimeric intracellular cation channel family protein [Ferruginibacter sp.]
MKHELLKLIDILGTVTFAISGVSAAMHKKLDLFGVLIIAFITAIGGGTLRDIMIGDLPVAWIRNIDYTIIIVITSTVAIFFSNVIKNFRITLLIFDSLGLGFFTVLGLQKGITIGLHPIICIALGTITGCFGGVIRDISLNNIPMIFQEEIYATAAIVGGCAYFLLLYAGLNKDWIDVISIALIFFTRIIVVRFGLMLPDIYGRELQSKGRTNT